MKHLILVLIGMSLLAGVSCGTPYVRLTKVPDDYTYVQVYNAFPKPFLGAGDSVEVFVNPVAINDISNYFETKRAKGSLRQNEHEFAVYNQQYVPMKFLYGQVHFVLRYDYSSQEGSYIRTTSRMLIVNTNLDPATVYYVPVLASFGNMIVGKPTTNEPAEITNMSLGFVRFPEKF